MMIMDIIQLEYIITEVKQMTKKIEDFLKKYPRYSFSFTIHNQILKDLKKLSQYLNIIKKEIPIGDEKYDCRCGKDCPHYTIFLNEDGKKIEGCRKALGL